MPKPPRRDCRRKEKWAAYYEAMTEWMKQQTGLDPHDICVNVRRTLAPTMAQGVPHFFQNGVSYWLIYTWRSKAPFRPVRF